MIRNMILWLLVLVIAFLAGKAVSRMKLPAILGWLIAGMLLGPNAAGLLPQQALDAVWYRNIITWMQCAFGLMLGTELVWRKIKNYGNALMITTLTQSLGTFAFVSLVFGIVFQCTGIPVYLALVFGGIALATAPAPALSIVSEFHTKGPVTDTLLPMAVLDDTGYDFFANRGRSGYRRSGGYGIKKNKGKSRDTCDPGRGNYGYGMDWLNTSVFTGITLNYMLMGVAFSAIFSNIIPEERLEETVEWFHPVLAVCLLGAIVDLGAPLDYHLILGAGFYTFLYIFSRACGKYFGARAGAKLTKRPATVNVL